MADTKPCPQCRREYYVGMGAKYCNDCTGLTQDESEAFWDDTQEENEFADLNPLSIQYLFEGNQYVEDD